jgi:hypothetical protein
VSRADVIGSATATVAVSAIRRPARIDFVI